MANSTTANSPIDICARALILIGADPITSFDDGTTEALVSVNMYEDVARQCLSATRWRFATEQAVLNLLSEDPTGRFSTAHQLPSNLLMLHAITVAEAPIKYTVYGDKVFSDVSDSSEVVADYTYRAGEEDWPSYFTLAVEYNLASIFASAIARNEGMAQAMEAKADRLMAKARSLDSQQQTTRKLTTSRFISERRS